jgi:hypothetical protein
MLDLIGFGCPLAGTRLRHLRDFDALLLAASLAPGIVPSRSLAVAIRPPLAVQSAYALTRHDRADFAQEFLRRNAGYRSVWARSGEASERAAACDEARLWGLCTLFDPARPVRDGPAIWRVETASQIVSLAPAPHLPGAAMFAETGLRAAFDDILARNIVIDRAGVRHRLRLLTPDRQAPLAILLPPLGDPLRAAACDAARRMMAGLALAEPAAALRPSALQHRRLTLLLRVLDASLAGASNREIGVAIVYPWLAGTDATAWKSTGERRRVQRLLAEARHLADAGHRELLRP